jgi:HEAT repeat protein
LAYRDAKVRRAAADAAGFHRIPGTAARIVELAKADPEGSTQYLRALGRLADPVALDLVITAATDPSGYTADLGVEALANFNGDRADAALSDLIKSSKWAARARVARALGRGRNAKAIDLLTTLANDENSQVRTAALSALSE